MIFDFERDFAASLRCIPMIVRQKLDLVKIKLTLRQWSRFPAEAREKLVALPCATPQEQQAYYAQVAKDIDTYCDDALRPLENVDYAAWEKPDACPPDVLRQAREDDVPPPTAAQWAALPPLKRFVLVKLASSKHENMNFVPALKEFGLLPST
ncbi:nitrate reductase associated protein [Oecophyllibacter saccharovorans]|uniref:Nitrate reductase associated protein n=1 Tax=Oecophyllibacter saccharovorans TaxID=2558360 RepID=A0A506UL76_9PROT|nr:nitrate reductase associated protein [Oecophyllibacter saccharovorans]TPW34089.1 hypothetical protein E3202_05990 [Oecophyllibacter saccharovorans]